MNGAPKIRLLPANLINRIAAGEVVERPASAVKELVENSLDAGATRIEITLAEGGKSLISVADNGRGMSKDELALALERHATSKLPADDLFDIRFFGFRGEALPSLASVSRMRIVSRTREAENAWEINVDAGMMSEPQPASYSPGTKIEVRDLFHAIPARLKFLKSERSEIQAVLDNLERLALAHPEVGFSLQDGKRNPLHYNLVSNHWERVMAVIGRDFEDNAIVVKAERNHLRLKGWASLPTFNRPSPDSLYFFVNNRPVKDKMLIGIARGVYQDVIPAGRYPILVLFLEIPPEEVDVNVHPAKTEVRFQDTGAIRSLIASAIHQALEQNSTQAAKRTFHGFTAPHTRPNYELQEKSVQYQAPLDWQLKPEARAWEAPAEIPQYPLGAAKAQINNTYIISETTEELVITDQHAAHERIVYEKIKTALFGNDIQRQILLIPEIVELGRSKAESLLSYANKLTELGIVLDPFGEEAVMVREIPAFLGQGDVRGLIKDLADNILGSQELVSLQERISEITATLACHSSVRAGRALNLGEMNALLRQMEATPNSAQCSHGRPTYIKLKFKEIEQLFERR